MAKILVAMSGGVDSAVCALLLRDAGHDVTGVFMKNYEPHPGSAEVCPWEADQADVAATCTHLGIPWESWNFEREYAQRVLEYFFREYQAGRTPNPDIMCNREIKFGVFLDRAKKEGYQTIATGHYARNVLHQSTYHLLAGVDGTKDQSYFLYTLNQDMLHHVLFPVGHLPKSAVRVLAKQAQLPVAEKPDSQGICFIGKVDVSNFLRATIPLNPGKIRTVTGEEVGDHDGVAFYTIGQRHGLGVGGGVPFYVAEKDIATNTLIVAKGNRDAGLYHPGLIATQESWVAGKAPSFPFTCQARIRYRQPLETCTLERRGGKLQVYFEKPQRAITPGQSIVFYKAEECLGGAVITSSQDSA